MEITYYDVIVNAAQAKDLVEICYKVKTPTTNLQLGFTYDPRYLLLLIHRRPKLLLNSCYLSGRDLWVDL